MRRKLPKPIKDKTTLAILRGIVSGVKATIKTGKKVKRVVAKAKVKGISKPKRKGGGK